MMNATTTPPDYGTVLIDDTPAASSTNLKRPLTTAPGLSRKLRLCTDGFELSSCRGHPVLPSTLDPRTRRELQPLFAELAALDAQLLGTAGSAAAAMARQLEVVADRLVAATHPGARIVSSAVPRQRDNASSDLPTSPHGSGSRPGRD